MSNSGPQGKQSHADLFMIGFLATAFVGAGWWQSHSFKVMRWYFIHYENIYLGLWGVILTGVGFVMYKISKKTQKIKERGDLLSPHWAKEDHNIFVGRTKDKVGLHLSDELRCTHVQIIGTTGRGKTQSVVIPWTMRDLERMKSVILIDGKGSRDVPLILRREVGNLNFDIDVFEFDLDQPENSVTINPLKLGTPQQITDRIFSSFEFDESYYRNLQYDICGYLLRLIQESDEVVTFKGLHELLTDEVKLTEKMKFLPSRSDLKRPLMDLLKISPLERRKNLSGLISQTAPFAVGEISSFVNGGKGEVSLAQVLKSPATLLMVSVPTLKYQKIGHQLGKLILQDLAFCIGDREKEERKEFVSVFLDEFSEFAYEGFASMLSKARSSKVGLHLSHQSMSDLSKVSPDFASSVITNTNIKCILGLNDPETADFFARHLGTFTQDKLTEQVEDDGFMYGRRATGKGSKREVESYKVHPNELKSFTRGKGVLHVPTSRGNITEVVQFQQYGGQH